MYYLDKLQLKKLMQDEELFRQFPLSKREIEILELISHHRTLQKIADQQGVTRQVIHQIYARAMRKIIRHILKLLKDCNENKLPSANS